MFQASGENIVVKLLEKETKIGSIIVSPESERFLKRNVEVLTIDTKNPVIQEKGFKVGDILRLPEPQIMIDNYMGEEINYINARHVLFIVPPKGE